MQMMSNADYIMKELPNINLPDELGNKLSNICEGLVGTKHDIINELDDLSTAISSSEEITHDIKTRINRIIRWIADDLPEIHELVMELQTLSKSEPAYGLAFMLVAESAVNILNAFNEAAAEAELVA